ncbi:hypothetical protein ACLIA0_09770 [Bacillaceae bacterium W0354]
MSFTKLLSTDELDNRQEELESMEFQVFRMRENMKEISKKYDVIGIDQTKHENWVIVFKEDDGETAQLMLNDCEGPFRQKWDSCIQFEYKDDHRIHIADIKGPEDQGYGSILMDYLKELAYQNNIQMITGDLVKRDWDHLERLKYFYEKHNFEVSIDDEEQYGEIKWYQYD